jgi:hypothetical protein
MLPPCSRRARLFALAVLTAALVPASSAQDAVPLPLPFRMTAFAVNLSGVGRTRPQTLDIVIERWSTDDEKQKLLDTLVEKGDDKLLDMVQKIKPRAGFIRTTQSLGWDIQVARYGELPDGGHRILFVTDRPMSFYELRNNTRSRDYDFMVCEIRLDKDGKGQGKLAGGTKITYDKDTKQVTIENYGQEPVRLTSVTADMKKKDEKKDQK